jgi:hypothetical protein
MKLYILKLKVIMKKLLYIIPLFLFGNFVSTEVAEVSSSEAVFSKGEKLEYRVHYGFINAGEATVQVHPELYVINNKICYKATCFGRSVGAFEMMTKIRDTWGSYIDTGEFIPQRSYRDITEGRYRLKEGVYFYHSKGQASAERENKKGEVSKFTYEIPYGVQDIISGFYFLRKLDYNKMKTGDTIKMNAFFEDELYDFRIRYLGKCNINTRFGKINAIKLCPIMPNNQLFNGESSIRVYLSDDKNKIPLIMQADMFLGAVEVELKNYQGLKYPMIFSKK